jgi:hypothetical protein
MSNKSRIPTCFAVVLIICVGLTGTASADIIWDQQQGNAWAAFAASTYFSARVADDFQLNTAASILSVGWAGGANDPYSVNGFHIRFYENDFDPGYPPYEDDPGQDPVDYHRPAYSPIYQQYIPIGNVIVSGPLGNSSWYFNYKANLPVSFEAEANTHYWFSIQAETGAYNLDPNLDTGTTQPWWGWLQAQTHNIDPGASNGDPVNGGIWEGRGYYDFTYSLDSSPVSTVPIPAAFWLLGTGLAGLFGIRRKIRK